MEQAETIQRANPFSMFPAPSFGYRTPADLRTEVEMLKQLILFQDGRIETLSAENADLHRLLGLRGEAAVLEQRVNERGNDGESENTD
jgi:hypothetical protein